MTRQRPDQNAGPQIEPSTAAVLRRMLEDPTADHYGLTLTETAGLRSGTIYPILARMEGIGWLTSFWEEVGPAEPERPRRRMYRLTDVGAHAAGGNTNPQIAKQLWISTGAVGSRVRRLLAKLGAHDRAQAVHHAWRHGLLGGDQ